MGRIYTDGQRYAGLCLGIAKLALCFQIPSQASLHRILKPHRPFCYANGPTLAPCSEIFRKKHRVALGLQAGRCFEKAPASPLASVFSTTNPAFAQRINPVLFSVFLFDSFAPAHLIRRFSQPAPPSELPCGSLSRLVPKSRFALRANLRLLYRAPAPALGCVYLGNPWLKIFSREEAQSSYAACGSGVTSYCVAGGAWWRRTDGRLG
jgi:hypothetical protein